MAAVTPQKRSLSPLKKSRNDWFASQLKWLSSSSDEMKENAAVPVKPALSRRLDVSLLQAASVPTAAQWESSRKLSPKPASSYKPLMPVVSFYSKEKRYLTPLERKQLNENHSLGERNREENLPAASRTEKMNMNLSRKTSLKPTKHSTKHGKTVPKTLKKAKGDVPVVKASVEKENVNCLIKKKMDSPFRVLSMTVKPALKLQLGAAFFSARKKSHSKKPVVDTKSLQGLPKSLQENDQPRPLTTTKSNSADRNKILEAGGILRSISTSLLILGFARELFSLVCVFSFLMRFLGVKDKGGNGTCAAVKYKLRTGLQTVSLHLMSYFAVAFWHLKLRKVGKGSAILL
uniref:Uncharacterized protein n=1 Tax=Buteo japonicus TaxID=224669 RepID=A0A8B9YYM9_9AVES